MKENISVNNQNSVATMGNNIEMQMDAIKKFVYFTFCYDVDFISLIWGENTVTSKHLEEKFEEYNGNVNRFFVNLDNDNQRKMMNWIIENRN